VTKELRNNPEAIALVSVDCVVVLDEHILEQVTPKPIQLTEALADETKKLIVGALLTAALDDHGRQLFFSAAGQVDAHQLVAGFLIYTGGHNGKVD